MAFRSVGRGLLLLAIVLGGCSQFSVRAERDPGADFAPRRTYAWLPVSEVDAQDQRVLDPYIDERIRAAVATGLGAKGYAPAGAAAPDLFLNYRLSTDVAQDDPAGQFVGTGWQGWGRASRVLDRSYDAGTLYLAAVDPASKRMIWVGAAGARILPWISLEQRTKRVDDAIRQILAQFPAH